jgi:hypothetical protein
MKVIPNKIRSDTRSFGPGDDMAVLENNDELLKALEAFVVEKQRLEMNDSFFSKNRLVERARRHLFDVSSGRKPRHGLDFGRASFPGLASN